MQTGGLGGFKSKTSFRTTPKMAKPPSPMKTHPAAQARIRLPQGNTGGADPGPYLPGVGKL
jgi:hypothetical protein